MSFQTITVDSEDYVTTLTFNRPERRNAMNPTMHREVTEVLHELEFLDECRVLVLTGAGDSFCAGQDLKEFFYDIDDDPVARGKARKASMWRGNDLRLFPKPTIAAVNGHCFGGAFTIVGTCDFAIAGSEAQFGLSEVNFGKIAGGHVSKVLTELLHPRDAKYYLLTGQRFFADEAERMKLVNKAVDQEDLYPQVYELAATLAQLNPAVLTAAKQAYQHVATMSWEQAHAWLSAKSHELDHLTGTTWRDGVEQFKEKQYKPGIGRYEPGGQAHP